MIIIKLKKDDTIEKAISQLKRKFYNTGVVKELKDRQAFEKPSVTKRNQKNKAKYIQKKFKSND